jgi:hypothetical protein
MAVDFTLRQYERLCRTIRLLECPVMTVQEFLECGQPSGFRMVVRHDVDRNPESALRMASLESAFGIRATYYFRTTSLVFRPAIISDVYRLNHEVGYHYETVAQSKGNLPRAVQRFRKELSRMRRITPIKTVSMHGSPLSSHDNLDLWKACRFQDFDLLGDFSLSIDAFTAYYFTDTGRSWGTRRYNLRDHIQSLRPERRVETTDEFIHFLRQRPGIPVLVNVHPNRWASGAIAWGIGTVIDALANHAKRVMARRHRIVDIR